MYYRKQLGTPFTFKTSDGPKSTSDLRYCGKATQTGNGYDLEGNIYVRFPLTARQKNKAKYKIVTFFTHKLYQIQRQSRCL